MNTQHKRAVPHTVGINKTRKDVPDTIRLSGGTNWEQLFAGNNVIVYTDGNVTDDMILKLGVAMNVYDVESCVIQGEDWPFQLRVEPIT